MNNNDLFRYHNQIQQWQQLGMIEAIFNGGKIKEFYKQNRIRINTLITNLNNMMSEHLEYENGKAKIVEGNFVAKEGCTIEQFEVEKNELMMREINILF